MAGGSLVSAMVLVAILAGSGISDVAAQSCFNSALSLTPCLNYLTGSTNGSLSGSPTQQCCDAAKAVINGGVQCFCQIITTSNPLGFVNRTLAFSIPGLCRIKTEPLDQCEENAGVPFLPTPESSPAPSPGEYLAPSPAGYLPAPKDSPSADSSPAETPSGDVAPNNVPLSPGKDASGSSSVGTDFLVSAIGILAGLISVSFLW